MPSKLDNTFKYETFNEQIGKIKVDLINQPRLFKEDNECDSYFKENLERWTELNCTLHYSDFYHEIKQYAASYIHVVHHQGIIIETLLKHLKVEKTLAFEPLLDLIIHLARDLQIDFYPHFHTFFNLFITLLESHCHHKVEDKAIKLKQLFTTLSYLIKYLWRPLSKDIIPVLGYYTSLLDERKNIHIKRFASESLTYLLRKVKDPMTVFCYLIDLASSNKNLQCGIAQLIAETLKGVNHQLHTSANQIVPILLSLLIKPHHTIEMGDHAKIIQQSFQLLVTYISSQNFSSVLLPLFKGYQSSLIDNIKKVKNKNHIKALVTLCSILNAFLAYKDGYFIIDYVMTINVLAFLVDLFNHFNDQHIYEPDLLDLTISIFANIMLNHWDKYDVIERRNIIQKLFDILSLMPNNRNLITKFVTSLEKSFIYREEVTPLLFDYLDDLCSLKKLEGDALYYMLYLTVHVIPTLSGQKTSGTSSAIFNLARHRKLTNFQAHLSSIILAYVQSSEMEFSLENNMKIYTALIITNALRLELGGDKDCHSKLLNKSFEKYKEMLTPERNQQNVMEGIMFQALMYTQWNKKSNLSLIEAYGDRFKDLQQFLFKNSGRVSLLKMMEIFLSTEKMEKISTFIDPKMIHALIYVNLKSTKIEVRVLSLKILKSLNSLGAVLKAMPNPNGDSEVNKDLSEIKENEGSLGNILDQCLRMDETPSNLEQFRQKLIYASSLTWDRLAKHPQTAQSTAKYPFILEKTFSFLLGALWSENMSPVIKQLQTYLATYFDQETETKTLPFWTIIIETLNSKEKASAPTLGTIDINLDGKTFEDKELIGLWQSFNEIYDFGKGEIRENPTKDLSSGRSPVMSTLEMLTLLPTKCLEYQNKEIITHFLAFFEEEYEAMMEEGIKHMEVGSGGIRNLKTVILKTLKLYLVICGKFRNPGGLYKCSELQKVYEKLLAQPESDIQKLALSCLATLKLDYLTPYKENLEKLISEITFKSELVLFNVDSQDQVVEVRHRQGLVRLVLRILYGKMQAKLSKTKAGGSQVLSQRRSILRYLAKFERAEIGAFIDLALEPLAQKYFNGPLDPKDTRTKTVPLKMIQGVLDFIDNCLSQLGSLLLFKASTLLNTILSLASNATTNPGADNKYGRIVKKRAILVTLKFFQKFSGAYHLTPSEKNELSDVMMVHNVVELARECSSGSSTFLKLILAWSRHPDTVQYLIKPLTCEEDTVLGTVIALLKFPTCHPNVIEIIFQIILNLFEPPLIESSESQASTHGDYESARHLIMASGDIIVSYALCKLSAPKAQRRVGSAKVAGFPLTPTELDVITLISSVERQACIATTTTTMNRLREKLIFGLLSVLAAKHKGKTSEKAATKSAKEKGSGKKSRSREMAIVNRDGVESHSSGLMDTLKSLVEKLDFQQFLDDSTSTDLFFKDICRLLLNLPCSPLRVRLMKVLSGVRDKLLPLCKEEAITMEHIIKTNASDPYNPEEPDYETRFVGFKYFTLANGDRYEALAPLTNLASWNWRMLLVTCCHTLNQSSTEPSLRNSCLDVLSTYISRVGKMPKSEDSKILEEYLIPNLIKGLKNNGENVFNDYVSILDFMVTQLKDLPQLRNLTPLKDTDMEKDFFQNIRHIQVHRRIKALRRLKLFLEEWGLDASSSSERFLTPLATRFIMAPTLNAGASAKNAAPNHTLVDTAISVLSTLAGRSDWRSYFDLLNAYLAKLATDLPKQKMYLKTIMALLDAFPFDLSTPLDEECDQNGALPCYDHDSTKVVENVNETENVERRRVSAPIRETICSILRRDLIPRLTKVFDAQDEQYHKSVDPHEINEEKLLRVPLALPIVKLILLLPSSQPKTSGLSINNIIFKCANHLKSRAQSLRDITRTTLCKISVSVAESSRQNFGAYLPALLDPLLDTLTRGYQVHALLQTLHSLLAALDLSNNFRLELLSDVGQGNIQDGDSYGATRYARVTIPRVLSLCLEAVLGKMNPDGGDGPGPSGHVISKGLDIFRLVTKNFSPLPDTMSIQDGVQKPDPAFVRGLAFIVLKPVVVISRSGLHSTRASSLKRLRSILTYVRLGLVQNPSLAGSPSTSFALAYGLVTGKLTEPLWRGQASGNPGSKKEGGDEKKKFKGLTKATGGDCFLLAPMNIRNISTTDHSTKLTNAEASDTLFLEFGLLYLHARLAGVRTDGADALIPFATPLIPVLSDLVVKSSGLRTVTLALRCLGRMIIKLSGRVEIDKAIGDSIESLKVAIFDLLYNYASVNVNRGETYDLVVTCLRTMATLIKKLKPSLLNLGHEHLRVLLTSYFEAGDSLFGPNDKAGASFALLKAILARKLTSPELKTLMSRVSRTMIQSDVELTRLQARQLYHQYLTHYCFAPATNRTGKARLDAGKQMDFLISNLAYETECGRVSLLEFLATLLQTIPLALLRSGKVSGDLLFLALTSRLANESSSRCKNMVWLTVKILIKRVLPETPCDLGPAARYLDMAIHWLRDEPQHRVETIDQDMGLALGFVRSHVEWKGRHYCFNNYHEVVLSLGYLFFADISSFKVPTFSKNESQVAFQMLGAQMVGLFVEMLNEGDFNIPTQTSTQMGQALGSTLKQALTRSAQIYRDTDEITTTDEDTAKPYDRLSYCVLSTVRKILSGSTLPIQLDPLLRRILFAGSRSKLNRHLYTHPHHWVRSEVNLIFNTLLYPPKSASLDPMALLQGGIELVKDELNGVNFLRDFLIDPADPMRIYTFADTFFLHLRSPYVTPEFLQSVASNLAFIGKVLFGLNFAPGSTFKQHFFPPSLESLGGNLKVERPPFLWFLYKVNKEFVLEAKRTPKTFLKRLVLLRMLGDVVLANTPTIIAHGFGANEEEIRENIKLENISCDIICSLLKLLKWSEPPAISPSTSSTNPQAADLLECASELRSSLKNALSPEIYSATLTKVDTDILKHKLKRKVERASLAVTDPFAAAKRKVKKNLRKVAQKRAIIARLKPYKKLKKSDVE